MSTEYLDSLNNLPENQRNYGYHLTPESAAIPRRNIMEAAPYIIGADEHQDTVLWNALFELWPNWKYGFQGTGDCHVAGTRVLMADGTERAIEEVRVGEYVITHNNHVRRVLRTIKKPYSGELVTTEVTGHFGGLTSTPDHKYVVYAGTPSAKLTGGQSTTTQELSWRPSGELCVGDRVLIPHGYLDKKSYDVSETLASPSLARGVCRLALQCRLQPKLRCRTRQDAHATTWKPAWEVNLGGESTLAVYPELQAAAVTTRPSKRIVTAEGLARSIRRITRSTVRNISVYCLEVEEDHSFIANGIAVSNCVSWGSGHLGDVILAVFALAGKVRKPDALICRESIYGFGKCELFNSYRYHGMGMAGIDAMRAWEKYGTLYYSAYPEMDLSAGYSGSRAKSWGEGGNGVPDALEKYAVEHRCRDRVAVTDIQAAGALVQSGYAIQYCGYTTWGLSRDANGVANRFKSGAHCMTITGVRYDGKAAPQYFWVANTGHGNHVSGPKGPFDVPDSYAACGAWMPAARYIQPVLQQGDCFTTSFVEGWPLLKLTTFGFPKKVFG
jgi:hypothetical protein